MDRVTASVLNSVHLWPNVFLQPASFLPRERNPLAAERQTSVQELVHRLIDGMRAHKYQRLDAVSRQNIGRSLTDAAADDRIGARQHVNESSMSSARVGGPTAELARRDGAILNLQDQKRGAARQMLANGDAIGSSDADYGRGHEALG